MTYYERLFVNIDENRLYFRDFWDKNGGDRRDYITDEAERLLASNCMLNMTKHKKYRKRFYRDKGDFKLLGNYFIMRQENSSHQRHDLLPAGLYQICDRHSKDLLIFKTHKRLQLCPILLPKLQDSTGACSLCQIQVSRLFGPMRPTVRRYSSLKQSRTSLCSFPPTKKTSTTKTKSKR